MKSENFVPATKEIATEYNIIFDLAAYGTKGYVSSTYSPYFWPATSKSPGSFAVCGFNWALLTLRTLENVANAFEEASISIAYDGANGDSIGGYFCTHNQDPISATRCSAQEAYYDTVSSRTNLFLLPGHQVTRLIMDTQPGKVKVTGVEVLSMERDENCLLTIWLSSPTAIMELETS
jgi:hypothetical protein